MPLCTEIKMRLTGGTQTYACELVHFEPGFGILRYVIDREYVIHGRRLLPGDVTLALYWEDRPCTLYIWKRAAGTVLHYFNIADRISLSPAEFAWRDLTIDILIDEQNNAHVLDAHELPPDLAPELASFIKSAQNHVLAGYREIIAEAGTLLKRYGC